MAEELRPRDTPSPQAVRALVDNHRRFLASVIRSCGTCAEHGCLECSGRGA